MRAAGAAVSTFLDSDLGRGRFRVNRRAFSDDRVLETERQRIFARCWLYVGHESELPSPGSFLRREVGGRPLIFNRDSQNTIRAFFNACPHRGVALCREKHGNAKTFRCFYHGWVFGNSGKLLDQPGSAGGYPADFNSDGAYDLASVPHLDSYRGFYFVNFDRSAASLAEYLGRARAYIDDAVDQSDGGLEIVGATQEYSIRANWKLLGENSIDGYHALPTHATYMDYMMSTGGVLQGKTFVGPGVDLGNGHAVVEATSPTGRPVAQWAPRWGESARLQIAASKSRLMERFGEERAERIATMNRNIVIFPNMAIVDSLAMTIRTFYPIRADLMHVNSWALGIVGEDPEFRARRVTAFQEFFAPGGLGVPDDIEALEACQQGYSCTPDGGWNDVSKGVHNGSASCNDEVQMRAFWVHWDRLMNEPAGA